jgi:hypothetical protein
MNREEIIKYSLIVLLSVLIIFILMRVLNLKKIKGLFVQENYDANSPDQPYAPVRQPSGNRDVPVQEMNTQALPQNKEVEGILEKSEFSETSSSISPSESAPSAKFKACNLKDNVKPEDLLPLGNTEFASLNPVLDGGLKNKQFLDPTKLMGTNTVGQSNRNQSYDLRSEPAIPKVDVGPWMNTTIEADLTRRPLE